MTIKDRVPPTKVDELTYELQSCREEIVKLKALETTIESKILELVGQKDEGATSQKGAYFTATTTGKVSRSIDEVQLQALQASGLVPAEAFEGLIRVKYSLDTKAWKEFHKTNPDVASLFDRCIVSRPGKTSVSIKRLD